MSLEGKRIGFIGAGAMAEALAGGVLASGITAESVAAADPDPVRRKHLSETLGITTVADNGEIVRDTLRDSVQIRYGNRHEFGERAVGAIDAHHPAHRTVSTEPA